MRFANWPFLLLLLLIPFLYRRWREAHRPARFLFSLPVAPTAVAFDPLKVLLPLKCLGLAFAILALARPQTSFRQMERTINGVDIVMVMDLSASMNIEDLGARSRFDIAKETMENFIKGRGNDRIGFVAFSGEPLTLAPPTLDYGLVLKALQDARIGVLRDGTAIGDGLSLAVSHLRKSKAKSRVIVLLTDGDNNVGQVDPGTAGELAAGYGIRVYTIAIGREGRVRMPIRTKGVFGDTIVNYQWFDNALNPELLRQIAEHTGGKFYRVTEEKTLASVFTEIDQLEKTEVKSAEKVKYEDMYQKPLKLGALVLAIERILALGWWRLVL